MQLKSNFTFEQQGQIGQALENLYRCHSEKIDVETITLYKDKLCYEPYALADMLAGIKHFEDVDTKITYPRIVAEIISERAKKIDRVRVGKCLYCKGKGIVFMAQIVAPFYGVTLACNCAEGYKEAERQPQTVWNGQARQELAAGTYEFDQPWLFIDTPKAEFLNDLQGRWRGYISGKNK